MSFAGNLEDFPDVEKKTASIHDRRNQDLWLKIMPLSPKSTSEFVPPDEKLYYGHKKENGKWYRYDGDYAYNFNKCAMSEKDILHRR